MSHKPIRLKFQVGAEEITVSIRAHDKAEPKELRAIEQALLGAATATPVPVKVLARKAGRQYGPAVRQAVADLVRGGRLKRTPEGVSLP